MRFNSSADPVSNWFGVEGHTSFFNHAGADVHGHPAVVEEFKESAGSAIASHSYQGVYLNHRDDFNATYSELGLLVQTPGHSIKLKLD